VGVGMDSFQVPPHGSGSRGYFRLVAAIAVIHPAGGTAKSKSECSSIALHMCPASPSRKDGLGSLMGCNHVCFL